MRRTIKPGVAMFTNIYRRLTQRKIAILLIFATAAHGLLMLAVDLTDRTFSEITIGLFLSIALPIATLITAGSALGDERTDHTMPFLLVKPVPRWLVTASALLASVATVLTLSLFGAGLAWFLGARATGDNTIGWPMLVAAILIAVGYTAVFLPIGLVAQRSTLIGLAYILVWEGIVTRVVNGAAASSIWRIGLTAYADLNDGLPRDADFLGTLTPGVGGAIAKIVALATISMVVTTWLLRHRDMA